MPCCDSMNTLSPRFFSEIFSKTSQRGISSRSTLRFSRCSLPTTRALPRELVFDSDGGERFRKYIPFPSFVNTIENYPYPYVIGDACWNFRASSPATGKLKT